MNTSPQHTFIWYDDHDDETVMSSRPDSPVALAEMPDSRPQYSWWLASLAFSSLWIAESWTSAEAQPGPAGVSDLVHSLWGLLLTLTLCYGILQLCKPRFRRLGNVLCILVAIAALLNHVL